MTTREFDYQFDISYNNIMNSAVPGLNIYEKSVFLTRAQEEILKNHLNPAGNKYLQGFDGSYKRQLEFSNLIEEKDSESTIDVSKNKIDLVISKDLNIFQIIQETLNFYGKNGSLLDSKIIVPLSYSEYSRILAKPYPYPPKRQVWRIDTTNDKEKDNKITLINNGISNNNVDMAKYHITYFRKPQPIILGDLTSTYGEGVSIEGKSTETQCELDSILHQEILQRAVELAKATYSSDEKGTLEFQNQTAVGQRSE